MIAAMTSYLHIRFRRFLETAPHKACVLTATAQGIMRATAFAYSTPIKSRLTI